MEIAGKELMKPLVSVCVPNLNTLPFLAERFSTIFEQTYQNWELLVYDSYSTDGAWEYISSVTRTEPRMRAWQGPREGTPGSWTPCIRQAKGKYVYIATSDDTMPPDCVQKLVAALEKHPECDLAHCELKAIDEKGSDNPMSDWWRTRSLFARSSGELLDRPHIRRAPFDGLLHLLGETVYTSITQLLIRRSLFDRVGMFESRWGSVGDFNWDMRAGLAASTIHVPGTWGGWRIHSSQATSGVSIGSPEHLEKIQSMAEDAIAHFETGVPSHLKGPLELAKDFSTFHTERDACHDSIARRSLILRRLLGGSSAAREYVSGKLRFSKAESWREVGPTVLKKWTEKALAGPVLMPL